MDAWSSTARTPSCSRRSTGSTATCTSCSYSCNERRSHDADVWQLVDRHSRADCRVAGLPVLERAIGGLWAVRTSSSTMFPGGPYLIDLIVALPFARGRTRFV